MTIKYDLNIKKPVALWNRELTLSPKEFFTALAKVAKSGVLLDSSGVADSVLEAFNVIAPEEKPAHAAWLLVYQSLQQSLSELIVEYKDFLPENIEESKVTELASKFEDALNQIDVGFNADFFDAPHQSPILDELRQPLMQWLTALGMAETEANAFHLRLKMRFVLSLHHQWLKNPSEYACIEDALKSPFVKASQTQRSWMQYNAWLQEQANERMFAEAFSLNQVYVPLRAYYEKKPTNTQDDSEKAKDSKVKKVVVDLHQEMNDWVHKFDSESAVRVISGGPGSGKSSFGKMFSAYMAREIPEVPVLFIQLHHFDPSGDLTSAVEQFIRDERYLTGSPLDATNGQERLLIIFDGLDELSMQGKVAAECANDFVGEVIAKIDKFNGQKLKRQALITGREMAIQSASNRLRGDKKILHVLPYFIPEDEGTKYSDPEKLLERDQREQWWENYGEAKGNTYSGMPKALDIKRLVPITIEPLLNYLVALSYERKQITFSGHTTLNVIYEDLLKAVHKRQWDYGCHIGASHLEYKDFTRILEEIALMVWHGDGRTATVKQIFTRCKNSNLSSHFEDFQEGAKDGVTRLLTAFYFRQSEQLQDGDKTFEFTHKSFGEYLTAKRIVNMVKAIHKGIIDHRNDPDTGINMREALRRWAETCGPTMMDEYVFRFLCDEVAAYEKELIVWQKTFADLLGYAVRNGMPMEELSDVPKFKQKMEQSRNAEELLMLVHFACAIKTKQQTKINWGNNTAFGEWLYRLQGQRSASNVRLILNCLVQLNLEGVILSRHDLVGVNVDGSNFQGANLEKANLQGANLQGAHLEEAHLEGANFQEANLQGAHLEEAHLEEANLQEANLRGAHFKEAHLEEAHLERAHLEEAHLEGANLKGANLKGAHLQRANLQGADLEGADLQRANFQGANLAEVNLQGARLAKANLQGASLAEARLERANLVGAHLERANLQGAHLEEALFPQGFKTIPS